MGGIARAKKLKTGYRVETQYRKTRVSQMGYVVLKPSIGKPGFHKWGTDI